MSLAHQKKYDLAKRLIAKHGRSVSLVATVTLPANPDRPWEGGGTQEVITETMAVFVPFQGSGFGETQESNSLLTGANEVCLLTVPPTVDIAAVNHVMDGGIKFGVEWREVLRPGEIRIIVGLGINR